MPSLTGGNGCSHGLPGLAGQVAQIPGQKRDLGTPRFWAGNDLLPDFSGLCWYNLEGRAGAEGLSLASLFRIHNALADDPVLEIGRASPLLEGCERTAEVLVGERKVRAFIPAIRELRLRCGQQDDYTTDLEYFIAANTQKHRRIAVVLIRRNHDLEACVLFIEHCRYGIGLGLWRGGDAVGDGLVAGPEAFRVQYVYLAALAVLKLWRVYGVRFAVRTSLEHCIEVMGPRSKYRMLTGGHVQRKLPLERTYHAMLAGMGPRTRRSLAGKRKQLEEQAHIVFVPSLEPSQALEAMLSLQPRSMPDRMDGFYHARYNLLYEIPDFFCMGLRLPDGTWLSVLSGWRRSRVTYVDLQMNDLHFKKESLSAVMRAFMLEHEITKQQELIHFAGGTSLLLQRYCQPVEPCTDGFFWRPGLRATIFHMVVPFLKPRSLYEHVRAGTDAVASTIPK
jgi:hypothetical protein